MNIFEEIYTNLIVDNTYKTILDGLFVTIRISVFSLLLAVILGFLLLLIRRSKNLFLSNFAKLYIAIVRGTPVLMLLMMMYYVVFAMTDVSAEMVAIITFAMNTAAYIAELLRASIEALDEGEIDAARTLGFDKKKAFFYITLPQCIYLSKPVFESTIINMIQWTSVVGYITITDLTRIINQVAVRTMRPTLLISIGMILYLLIAYIVKWLFVLSNKISNKKNVEEHIDKISENLFINNSDNKNSPLVMENVSKSFDDLIVYKNLNFNIKNGEVVSVIGPSGCGKSVFLKLAVALLKPDKGNIYINGQSITNNNSNIDLIRRNVGFVYQSYNLFSHIDILKNLMLAPKLILKQDDEYIKNKALQLLNIFGLLHSAHKMPNELSGGQKQRVAIARCLMMNPKLLLLDEPTSALDPSMTGEVLATIRMLKKYGITMIVVTHEMNFAKQISDRVCFIEENGIYEEGPPSEIFENPKKIKTITFIKKLKSFEYNIYDKKFDLYELKGKMLSFAEKYGIDFTITKRLEIVVEEVVYEILNNMNNAKINIVIEYSDLDKNVNLIVQYIGELYNIFNANELNPEHLGVLIIKRSSKSYNYIYKNNINILNIIL